MKMNQTDRKENGRDEYKQCETGRRIVLGE